MRAACAPRKLLKVLRSGSCASCLFVLTAALRGAGGRLAPERGRGLGGVGGECPEPAEAPCQVRTSAAGIAARLRPSVRRGEPRG